jgi:hypothetical protein
VASEALAAGHRRRGHASAAGLEGVHPVLLAGLEDAHRARPPQSGAAEFVRGERARKGREEMFSGDAERSTAFFVAGVSVWVLKVKHSANRRSRAAWR